MGYGAPVLGVEITMKVGGIVAGVAVAKGCVAAPAPDALLAEIDAAVGAGSAHAEARKGPVRDMLRFGKYKPTGRGKPACEYLMRSAGEGRFPKINGLVDTLNLVSFREALPISLLDLERTGGSSFVVRRGRDGESFVFNAGGQTIGLFDLLLVAGAEDAPFANPVKDSMASKLVEASSDVMAVVYAPEALADAAAGAAEALADGFQAWCGATETAHGLIRRTG